MTDWHRSVDHPDVDLDGATDTLPIDVSRSGEYVLDSNPSPSEVFQALASDVRIHVLVHLLDAEQNGRSPCSFSDLQTAAGSDSSAGFAYHLRQLDGHFVEQTETGYVLTPAGRRAARSVIEGTFTSNESPRSAS